MIIYNVTVNIEESIADEWKNWMINTHIPEVMDTQLFIKATMTKVLVNEEMGGITYSIQYQCESDDLLEEYKTKYAKKLQEKHSSKYQSKFVAFRTLLELVKEF